jgi:Yip1 domain
MEPTAPNVELPPPVPPEASTSLFTRLTNVFAAPGELFDEVKVARHSVANWVVPAIIAAVVGVAFTLVMFSQPTIQRKIREQQEKAMEKQVQAGKMTQQQADQALEMTQKFTGPMMKIFGSIAAVVVSFVRLFWWALVLWLMGRWFFKVQFPYMKAVEVVGLSSMIAVLGGIVALLLMLILGKMFASASLALLVSDFDMTNKKHFLLGAVNLFNFWMVAVMGLGLARVTGQPSGRAMLLFFAYWIAMSLALIAVGLGQWAL